MSAVEPKPKGFHTVTPYLIVSGAAQLIEFVTKVFEAEEISRTAGPGGTIMHAQVRIGDSMIEVSDARGEYRPMPCAIHVYVEDADTVYHRALEAGATPLGELGDRFYGDREGNVADAFGNYWFIATHKEDVSAEELQRRMAAMGKH